MYTRYAVQPQAAAPQGVPSSGVSPLRIATFNLLHGRPLAADGSPLPFPAEAADPLHEAIAALDADVLALQEVDRHQERSGGTDQTAVAAKAMGAADWRFAAALHGRPAPVAGWLRDPSVPGLRVYGPDEVGSATDLPSYGTALLTRLPVRHWRARRFAPAPFGLPLRVAGRRGLTPVPDEPRAALAAVLEGTDGPFTVVATHLSFVPGWNMAQLAGIRRWIADLPQPYLVLGDFNLVGAVPGRCWAGPPRWTAAPSPAVGPASCGPPAVPGWSRSSRAAAGCASPGRACRAGRTWSARPPTLRTGRRCSSTMCWRSACRAARSGRPRRPGSASPTTGRWWWR